MSRLGECLRIKHGWPFKGEYFANNGELSILTPGNFYEQGGFKFNDDRERYYTGDFPSEYLCKKGDLIVAMTEQAAGLLGSTAIVPCDNRYLHNQRIGLVLCDEQKLTKMYAYYLFMTKSVRKQISRSSSGTKVKHTSPEKIYEVEVELPDIPTQKRIAHFLWTIDSKIRNNCNVNEILEKQAKLLYDFWFVQFDFPDENGKPYKSSGGKMVWNEELKRDIPDGWEVSTLRKKYRIERGISYSSKDIESGQGMPMINLACIDTKRNYRHGELKYYDGNISDDDILSPFDLLIACTDLTRNADIVGSPILTPNDGKTYTFSTDIAKLIPNETELNPIYLYMALRTEYYHNYIKKWASGTNVLHLDLTGLDWYKMWFPPKSLQDKFAETILQFENKKFKTMIENRELTSLRDFLLPMLMNGQVKVKKEDTNE